jgi:hypothetical protein
MKEFDVSPGEPINRGSRQQELSQGRANARLLAAPSCACDMGSQGADASFPAVFVTSTQTAATDEL